MKNSVASAALAASIFSASSLAADCENVLTPDYKTPSMAEGWTSQLIVKDLTRPRTIAFDTEGNLLIVERGKGISRLSFKDNGGTCLEVERSLLIVENEELNHGMAISNDGKTLYASTVENVFAWTYEAETGTVESNVTTVITNMSNNVLTTRTLLMSKKEPGKLIVTRGADENHDVDAMDINTGLSQIRMFDVNNRPSTGAFDFNADGAVLGWGLRNAVGVAEEPTTGGVYSVEASIDDIFRDGEDVHQDNPGEELNFHGTVDVDADHRGDNYGYPVCYALWDTELGDFGDLSVGDQFGMNSTDDAMCESDYKSPRLTFHAHTSPLGILFSDDGEKAYIAFHGSFNRDNPVGNTIAVIDFKDGEPVAGSTSTDAAIDIMKNPDQTDCPGDCFRPLGLAWDSQGRLWMSSDTTGEIYVLQKSTNGSGGSDDGDSDGSTDGDGSGSDEDKDSSAPRGVGGIVFAAAAAVLTAMMMS